MKTFTSSKFYIARFYFFVLIAVCQKHPAQAQTPQDCIGATPICQSVHSENNAYQGTGNISEEINPSKSCLASGEKNDAWYTFTVQSSGILNFSIIPNDMDDDYDWAVFNITNHLCSDIANIKALEVSCSYDAQEGITGANGQMGPQNEQPIQVLQGETYVINVSQFSPSLKGYKINFEESTATIFDQTEPRLLEAEKFIFCGDSTIKFTMSENILCSSVDTNDFKIIGAGGIMYTISNIQSFACANDSVSYDRYFEVTITPPITVGGLFQIISTGQITDLCGNASSAYTDTVKFIAIPFTSLVNNVAICENDGSSGAITVQGQWLYNFYLNTVSPQNLLGTGTSYNPSATLKMDTTYQFLITQLSNGCESSADTISYTIGSPQSAEIVANPTQVIIGNTTTVTFTGSAAPNATYTWDFDGAEIVSGENQGPYTIKWTTSGNKKIALYLNTPAGCNADTAYATVVVPEVLLVPNATNLEGEGINNIFKINSVSTDIAESSTLLYNQWGQKIYETNNLHTQGWDDIFNSQLSPLDIYYYFITTTNTKGKQKTYKGNITLIK